MKSMCSSACPCALLEAKLHRMHRPWRTFVDPAEGPGAYQVAKLEVGEIRFVRAVAPRPGRRPRAQP